MAVDYRFLLKKYINHVAVEEGTTFLNTRSAWPDSPEFTDEEWAALQQLDEESLEMGTLPHLCSCHVNKNRNCGVCAALSCTLNQKE